jgi:hypothetical protein
VALLIILYVYSMLEVETFTRKIRLSLPYRVLTGYSLWHRLCCELIL